MRVILQSGSTSNTMSLRLYISWFVVKSIENSQSAKHEKFIYQLISVSKTLSHPMLHYASLPICPAALTSQAAAAIESRCCRTAATGASKLGFSPQMAGEN
jgi:hypothetical protein